MTPLVELRDATRTFGHGKERIVAVDSIDIAIEPGEVVCLVGESGCGKSTTGRMVAGLLPPTSGQVLFQGQDIAHMDRQAYRRYRLGVQIVHQDPYASLNPTQTVRQMLTTPLLHHGFADGRVGAVKEAVRLLEVVDLAPAVEFLDKYPHQLSGGQRQRVSVARALTVKPSFIVADEAVSMVDVSLRVSLLKMLSRLRNELEVTFLFITHDLALAKYFAWEGRIIVMYLGRIVEEGSTPRVIQNPRHPYTQVLLSAVPEADPEIARQKRPMELRSANIPSLLNLPPGCAFHPRCPFCVPGECDTTIPALQPVVGDGRAACPVINRELVAQ
ncbi:MAG TPA: ABC transporter ATP-binding protein [Candidatus Binatia bacterium]|jgi:peptide/nickel transport system ATP-binding protein|nr:ABC transporter ATP-binding protein [Candidatus Binatia bacterium]